MAIFRGKRVHLVIYLALLLLCQGTFIVQALAETHLEMVRRGEDAFKSGDDQKAIEYFQDAKNSANTDPFVRMRLAALFRRNVRLAEAEAEYRALILLEPAKIDWKFELADILVEQGNFSSALAMYQELAARDPKDPRPILGMATCLESTDSIDSARDYYQSVIRLAPESEAAEEAQDKLTRLDKASSARASNQFFPIDPDLGAQGLGWWDLRKMPLSVYIDSGEGVTGYRDVMRGIVIRALEQWISASGGKIGFVLLGSNPSAEAEWRKSENHDQPFSWAGHFPADPIEANIHVHFVKSMSMGIGSEAMGLCLTNAYKGMNLDADGSPRQVISKAHVFIAVNRVAGKAVSSIASAGSSAVLDVQDRLIQEVSIHELGHALGLTHSSHPGDIMCSGVYAHNATDISTARGLSSRDEASLRQHYSGFNGSGLPANVQAALDSKEAKSARSGSSAAKGPVLATKSRAFWTDSDLEPEEHSPHGSSAMNHGSPSRKGTEEELELKDISVEIHLGKLDACLNRLNRILAESPKNPTAHYLRAVTMVKLRKYPEAAADYRAIIKLAPQSHLAKLSEFGLKKLKL